MRAKLDLNDVFPIKDEASAKLMRFKAECLLRAGIITERERQAVDARAVETLKLAA